jgi:hypothetical protein
MSASPADATECAQDAGVAAEMATDDLHSWKSVYSWYRQFRQCDDGGVSEGFSEAVARLMADRWASLPKALAPIRADPAFEAFVVGHLNDTDDYNDLLKVDRLARTDCPIRAQELCAKIHTQIQSLVRD